MNTLIVATAASLLALAAPAAAQSWDGAHRHHPRHHVYGGYRSAPSNYGSGDVYVREGRASAPDAVPGFAWRPGSQEEGVGADLVGPGMDSPTDQHDVSR
jgi:hypothetical protein